MCISLPHLTEYRKDFDKTQYFLIKDDELLEKFNELWENVSNSIKKEFDSEPIYDEKYLKPKIKSFEGKIKTNFTVIKYKRRFSIYLSIGNID